MVGEEMKEHDELMQALEAAMKTAKDWHTEEPFISGTTHEVYSHTTINLTPELKEAYAAYLDAGRNYYETSGRGWLLRSHDG